MVCFPCLKYVDEIISYDSGANTGANSGGARC